MGNSSADSVSKLKRLDEKLKALDYQQKVLFLILLALAVYGTFIVADFFFVGGWINSTFGPNPDLDIYR